MTETRQLECTCRCDRLVRIPDASVSCGTRREVCEFGVMEEKRTDVGDRQHAVSEVKPSSRWRYVISRCMACEMHPGALAQFGHDPADSRRATAQAKCVWVGGVEGLCLLSHCGQIGHSRCLLKYYGKLSAAGFHLTGSRPCQRPQSGGIRRQRKIQGTEMTSDSGGVQREQCEGAGWHPPDSGVRRKRCEYWVNDRLPQPG